MQFIDRKAKYPGRWTMKKSDGTSEVVTLVRNDEPIVEGTPINANTLNELSGLAISIDPTLSVEGKAADAKATGDAVGALKEDIDNIRVKSSNLYNPNRSTPNKVIKDSGEIVDNDNYCISEPILVKIGESIAWKAPTTGTSYDGVYALCRYKEVDMSFISRATHSDGKEHSWTNSDAGNRWVRFVVGKKADKVQINYGDTLQRYIPYGKTIIKDDVLPEWVAINDSQLKEDVDNIRVKLNSNYLKYTIDSANQINMPYLFEKGKRYFVKNTSEKISRINLRTYNYETKEVIEIIASNLRPSTQLVFIPTLNAQYLRVISNGAASFEIYCIDTIDGKIKYHNDKMPSMIKLVPNNDIVDTSELVSKINYTTGKLTILEQVYSLLDALMSENPLIVTKFDAASEVGLTYPIYANGITTEGEYKITPSYRTYMYKISQSDQKMGNGDVNVKRKILIIGATHGNEIAAPFNLYQLAYNLCNLSNDNYFGLLSSFDFYIIPCLNGYGMYHGLRCNANRININRNYPITDWAVSGEDTKYNDTGCQYTGETAGSEFETKLVMEITKYINPDICIDHHNYSVLNEQFYTEIPEYRWLRLAYRCANDCFYTFCKHFPQYFGKKYHTFAGNGSAPEMASAKNIGTTTLWWHQYGIKFECTLEISECINFVNGEYNENKNDDFGNNTFSIAEYTLRRQLVEYCQYILDNVVN